MKYEDKKYSKKAKTTLRVLLTRSYSISENVDICNGQSSPQCKSCKPKKGPKDCLISRTKYIHASLGTNVDKKIKILSVKAGING
jgi:hypothetical protein